MANRQSWDEYFVELLDHLSSRSTCDRGKPATIITKDNRILSTGYAGSPSGLPHCDDVGHELATMIKENGTQSQHCIRTIHSEINAIVNAARYGIALEGGTLYSTMTPCYSCAKAVINAGIKRIIVKNRYHTDERSIEAFREARIKFKSLSEKQINYKNK